MDYLSRIGLVLEDLVNNSTLNGDRKAEALRLAAELQSVEDNLVAIVNDRVRAATEAQAGRLDALEAHKDKVDTVLFSSASASALGFDVPPPSAEEEARLKELFNGAEPKAFDHDGDSLPGGSLPQPATSDIDQMTVAQLKDALTEAKVDIPADAKKADLQELLKAATDGVAGGTGNDTITPASGPDTISGT